VLAVCVHYNNQSAIERAQSSMYNGKSRHIYSIYNIAKNLFLNGIISIHYVKSKKNIMDLLTKGLSRELMYNSSRVMDIEP
jgi:hypothetical protein